MEFNSQVTHEHNFFVFYSFLLQNVYKTTFHKVQRHLDCDLSTKRVAATSINDFNEHRTYNENQIRGFSK